MQYIPTDLPQYWKIHPRSDFSEAIIQEDHVLIFSQDGQSLTVKKPDGTFEVLSGSNSFAGLQVGVLVDDNGILKVQPLSFNGTEASDSGSLQEYDLKIFNTGRDEPDYGGSVVPATSMAFYKCSYVNSDSWGGYKAVLNAGVYTFESDSTHSLYYSDLRPVVTHIYTSDASFQVTDLNIGIPRNPVFFAPLTSNATKTGQSLTNNNVTYTYDSSIGSTVAVFNGADSRLTTTDVTGIPTGSSPRCFSAWARIDGGSGTSVVMMTSDGLYQTYGSLLGITYSYVNGQWRPGLATFSEGPYIGYEFVSEGTWHHYLGNITDSTFDFYVDGVLIDSISKADMSTSVSQLSIGAFLDLTGNVGDYTYTRFLNGRVLACRIYDRALSSTQITALSQEFTPTA